MNTDNLKITNHAVSRFLSRGRLMLYPHEKENPKYFIKKFMSEGYRDIRLDNCPFYKNKLGCSVISSGRFRFYIKNNTVITILVKSKSDRNEWRY